MFNPDFIGNVGEPRIVPHEKPVGSEFFRFCVIDRQS